MASFFALAPDPAPGNGLERLLSRRNLWHRHRHGSRWRRPRRICRGQEAQLAIETVLAPRPKAAGNSPAAPRCGSASAQPAGIPNRAAPAESSEAPRQPKATDAATRATAPPQHPTALAHSLPLRPYCAQQESSRESNLSPSTRQPHAAPEPVLRLPTPAPQTAADPDGRAAPATAPTHCKSRSDRQTSPATARRY